MRGAFVLRLGSETKSACGRFEGWVEEVDTGHELRFRSAEELLGFLGQRFSEALRVSPKPMRSETVSDTSQLIDSAQTSIPEAEVQDIISALADSWNRHDMAAYAALFTKDADFVNVLGMSWRGRREIETTHTELHRTVFRNSTLRVLDQSVRLLNPNVAVDHSRWEMRGHEGLPGWAETRHGLMSLVLVRQADGWLIVAAQNTEIVPIPAGIPRGENANSADAGAAA